MNGQPSPYSDGSDIQQDAKRYRLLLSLSRMEVAEMNPEVRKVWDRFVRGGMYTKDLENQIDALLKLKTITAHRGGYAGAEQE